jgi:hypothetical protein
VFTAALLVPDATAFQYRAAPSVAGLDAAAARPALVAVEAVGRLNSRAAVAWESDDGRKRRRSGLAKNDRARIVEAWSRRSCRGGMAAKG